MKEKKPIQVQMADYDPNGPLTMRQRLRYSSGDGGYHFIYNWVNVFLTAFCTDVLGVAAGAVSALLLYVRFFDAINDPIIGSMADRTRTKWGRYRPWIFGGGLAMGLLVATMFSGNPSWDPKFKLIFVYVVYILITIASTCENMAYGAMNGVITANSKERLNLGSQRMMFMYSFAAIIGAVAMPLVRKFATNTGNVQMDLHNGYRIVVPIFCAVGIFLICRSAVKSREAVPPTDEVPQKVSLIEMWKAVIKNPPMIIMILGMTAYGMMAYGRMAMFVYYFKYFCNNYALMSTYSLLNGIFGFLGAVSAATITAKITKSKGRSASLGLIFMGIFNIICYWIPGTNPLFWVFMALSSFSGAVYISNQYGMIPECADYGEMVTGRTVQGFTNAFTSFALKVGGAMGPAIGVALLGKFGYVANEVQTATSLHAINIVATIGPGLICALAGVIFAFYPLTPAKQAEVRRVLDERKAAQKAQ